MKIIAKILLTALTLLLVAEIIPGIEVENMYAAIIAALILGILNVFIRPILVILTLPITLLTLGLFMFVINAGLFLFAASIVDGFSVAGFIPALLGSLLVTVAGVLINNLLS